MPLTGPKAAPTIWQAPRPSNLRGRGRASVIPSLAACSRSDEVAAVYLETTSTLSQGIPCVAAKVLMTVSATARSW
ncbi:MAG: hypothetical protein Udaeo2_12570 [Candidatus Udaeobacter sp.]|nr:MAG: hypothetical protein Udaeo2_12570 [Candidatus Udaeobacter sp.]